MSSPRVPALLCLVSAAACGATPIEAPTAPVEASLTPPVEAEPQAPFEPAPVVPLIGPFGTASPSFLVAHDPAGEWFVACQARDDTDGDGRIRVDRGLHGGVFGDAMRPYLFMEPGLGEPIDAVLSVEESGDRIVYRTGRTVVLANLRTSTRETLGELSAADPLPIFELRYGRLLYRVGADSPHLTVRDLADRSEVTVEVHPNLVRASIGFGGRFVTQWVTDRDTNGDGAVTPMHEATDRADPGPCRVGAMVSMSAGFYGDRPSVHLGSTSGGPSRPLEDVLVGGDVVYSTAAGVLVRTDDGALALDRLEGQQEVLAPADCVARVRAVCTSANAILVRCARHTSETDTLEIHAPGRHQVIDVPLGPPEESPIIETCRRGVGSRDLDLETGQLRQSPEGNLLFTRGDRYLFERDHEIHWHDASTGIDRVLGPSVARRRTSAGGQMVGLGDWTIDMGAGRSLGYGGPPAYVLLASGRRLTANVVPRYMPALPQGPFHWFDPPAIREPGL